MEEIKLYNELNDLSQKLEQAIRIMAKYGKENAQAECDYKVKLRQEALKLRDGGMAVTLIDKVVYGDREVAKARMNRDIAEAMYKTAQENINSIKLQIRILDNQIGREWGQIRS